ncbi:hypothetical protein [Nocardia tengchongensis]|uniref:hypothetical protein n=1 Tax=Nocardia tengchongensis TaxID=2055889 RepID=UPI003662D0F9
MTDPAPTPATTDRSLFGEALAELRTLRDGILATRIRTILAAVDAMGQTVADADVRAAATAGVLREQFAALADELDPPK